MSKKSELNNTYLHFEFLMDRVYTQKHNHNNLLVSLEI